LPPRHVVDLPDYWLWLDRLIAQSGGYLESLADLQVQLLEDPAGDILRLLIPRQVLHFYDGTFLAFSLSVDHDLGTERYRFHFAQTGGELIWRLDKHRGHENEDGGFTHIHEPGNVRRPHWEVDFEEVLAKIASKREP